MQKKDTPVFAFAQHMLTSAAVSVRDRQRLQRLTAAAHFSAWCSIAEHIHAELVHAD